MGIRPTPQLLEGAQFCAAAREGWPAALDEIDRLKTQLVDIYVQDAAPGNDTKPEIHK